MQPEETDATISEETNNFHLQCEANQPTQGSSISSLFLGLSLPVEPKIGECASNNFSSTTLPLLKSINETRTLIQDAMPHSTLAQTSSLLRHKLDSIVSRPRSLNGRGSIQHQFELNMVMWCEEELDFLWIGVRRHGRDNWDALLRDPRLHFSSLKVARDLAERWEEEQSKLLNGTHVSQFRYSDIQNNSWNNSNCSFLGPRKGIWRENLTDGTQLSLGDIYAQREVKGSKRLRFRSTSIRNSDIQHFQRPVNYPNPKRDRYSNCGGAKHDWGSFNCLECNNLPRGNLLSTNGTATCFASKGNLPHWLREVINAPLPRLTGQTLPSIVSLNDHSGMHSIHPYFHPSEPCFVPRKRIHGSLQCSWESDMQPSSSAHLFNYSLGVRPDKNELSRASSYHVKKPDDVIIINSDASSEETISDDHAARPLA